MHSCEYTHTYTHTHAHTDTHTHMHAHTHTRTHTHTHRERHVLAYTVLTHKVCTCIHTRFEGSTIHLHTSPLTSFLQELLHCILCLFQFLLRQDHLLRGEVPSTGVLQLGHWKTRQAGLKVHRGDAAVLEEWVLNRTAAAAAELTGELKQEAAGIYN